MSKTYLLDTNIVSYIIKGHSTSARERTFDASRDRVAISAVTEGEICFGLAKAGASQKRLDALDLLHRRVEVLPWGRQEASVYGTLRAQQERSGRSIAALDMMIAAHAVSLGATLVTHDTAFRFVGGLKTKTGRQTFSRHVLGERSRAV